MTPLELASALLEQASRGPCASTLPTPDVGLLYRAVVQLTRAVSDLQEENRELKRRLAGKVDYQEPGR